MGYCKKWLATDVKKRPVVKTTKGKTTPKTSQFEASEQWKTTNHLLLIFAMPQQLSNNPTTLGLQDTANTAIIYVTASAKDSSIVATFLDKKPNGYWAADENLAASYSLEVADNMQAVLLLKMPKVADKTLYVMAFKGKLDDLNKYLNKSGVLQPVVE